jgi:hypothetical protein
MAKAHGDPRRGIPEEAPVDLKLGGLDKNKYDPNDPSSYKVCQFYLHEFLPTDNQAPAKAQDQFGEGAAVIAEIEAAFCGFFEPGECDMAYKDHSLDVCEAAYQLACDAEENRFKQTLPLSKSVLLCESLVASESAAKKGGEGEVTVAEGSVLSPQCLIQGRWVINGQTLSYHSNCMSTNAMVHVFTTNENEERPITLDPILEKTRSVPMPLSEPPPEFKPVDFSQTIKVKKAEKKKPAGFEEEGGFDGIIDKLDPSGLFDFKQPDLQRDKDFFKQMIL